MTESYLYGKNALMAGGPGVIRGQTFRPKQTHECRWVMVELWWHKPFWPPYIVIKACDLFNRPYGPALSTSGYFHPSPIGLGATQRVIVNMPPVTLYPTGLYAILLMTPELVHGEAPSWWMDKDGALYGRGTRIISDDYGQTWTTHITQDHMFAEMGIPHIPDMPEKPPLDKWLLTNIKVGEFDNGVCIEAETNVPAELSCYWTRSRVLTHKVTRVERGLAIPAGARFCFVAPTEVHQVDEWETIIHKFVITPLEPDTEFWYTFKGYIDGMPSPSTGPIFRQKVTGKSLCRNPSFDDWPFADIPPLHWTFGVFGTGSSKLTRQWQGVKHGKYCALMRNTGYARGCYLEQIIDPRLYQGQQITFKQWGKGYNYSNNDLVVSVNGTNGWAKHANLTLPQTWEEVSLSGFIPWDATELKIASRAYCGPLYSATTRWDKITLEVTA